MVSCLENGQWSRTFQKCVRDYLSTVTVRQCKVCLESAYFTNCFICECTTTNMYAYALPPRLPLFFSKVKPNKSCGPPPSVPFADIVGTSRQEYKHGDWVKFKCKSYYILQAHESTQCINGRWSNTIMQQVGALVPPLNYYSEEQTVSPPKRCQREIRFKKKDIVFY